MGKWERLGKAISGFGRLLDSLNVYQEDASYWEN